MIVKPSPRCTYAGIASAFRCVLTANLLFGVSQTLYSQNTIQPGLVAHYRLDGNANDSSGNHLHGVINGTVPTPDRFGNGGKALLFNGITDRINCGNPAQFNFAGDFTLSAWVKLNGEQINRYIVAKYDFTDGSTHSYGLGTAFGTVPYGFVLGEGPGYEDLFGNLVLGDEQWHAISVAFEGGNSLRLYMDGQLAATRPVGDYPPFVNSVPLIIGGTFSGQEFGGAIDDVRIYDRALTDSEVAQQFQSDSPEPPPLPDPIAYYPLDGDAKDKGGNHLNGVLVGTEPTVDRFGKKFKALSFNGGSDRVNCGNPAAFNFAGNFTLSAWVRLNGNQFARYFVAKYDDVSAHSYGFGTGEAAESYGFVLGDGPFYEDLRGPIPLNDDAWHAVAFVLQQNSSIRLYLDGNLVASRFVGAYPPFVSSIPLMIGGTLAGPGFDGDIDDVRIYDQALSNEEIRGQYIADTPKTPVDSGLVAHYKLNGSARDSSKNRLHGELFGATPTVDRFGKNNRALLFNGISDYVNCGDPAQFNFGTNFTLKAWVKADGVSENRYIVAKYDPVGGAHSYGLGIAGPSAPYGFVFGAGPSYEDVFGPPMLNDGLWHSVVLVLEQGSGLLLYADGQLVGARFVGGYPAFENTSPLVIGGTIAGQFFGGAIDDVAIYRRALSAEEVLELYEDEVP